MTMNEKKLASLEKELQKVMARTERDKALLEKRIAKCEKLGCVWTSAEHNAKLDILRERHPEMIFIPWGEDNDIMTEKQNSAWWDMEYKRCDCERNAEELARAEKRFDKMSETVKAELEANETFRIEFERISEIERKMLQEKAKADYEAWVKEFTEECAKDGIIIDTEIKPTANAVYGTTPSGKRFTWYINSGCTERSWHCYTLSIEGKGTVFTSGQWWLCYNTVKNN